MDPAADALLIEAGIERVYVTLGNHEIYSEITPLLNEHPGHAVRVSDITWILPRPSRLTIGGRSVLSLGGATSVDKAWRQEGVSWWPEEDITDEQVRMAVAGGPADLMLTHEGPDGTPVNAVRAVLSSNPMGFPDDALADSLLSRRRVAKVWDLIQPRLLAHGHMHAPGGGQTDDGRRVASLGCDGQQGSIAFLDMFTLTMQTPTLRDIRDAAGR